MCEKKVSTMNAEQFLKDIFKAAINAGKGEQTLIDALPSPPKGKTIVIGAGKAAATMAKTVEDHYTGNIDDGLVITRYGHSVHCRKIRVVEASHPLPDGSGQKAALSILEKVSNLTADDLVICLLSGGGSALMSIPAAGIPFTDKQALNKSLLKCGADIAEINCVRKHISAVKGGRLAKAAYPARVISYAISDVPGDDPAVIASGPTVPDPTTFADTMTVIRKYGIKPSAAITDYLNTAVNETPKAVDPCFDRCRMIITATPQQALEAAASFAERHGITPLILGSAIEGEARETAKVHAGIVKQIKNYGQPCQSPCVILSGGETTVTVGNNNGRGGRNTEFTLALAEKLNGVNGVYAIAGDTDGIDGTENAAGAIITPDTLKIASEHGLKACEYLHNNDSYSFFERIGSLVITGPTLTNVNDFRAILIV